MTNRIVLLFGIVCCILLCTFTVTVRADDEDSHHDEPAVTTAKPTVRFINDFVPKDCPITVKRNYLTTFRYTAHVVTPDNRIGRMFDKTEDYHDLTLQINSRAMLKSLAMGMVGMCIEGKRTIIIPPELGFGGYEDVPDDVSVVFIVTVKHIEPFVDTFDNIDTDHSGCITLNEMKDYVRSTEKLSEGLVGPAARRLFKLQDKNKDGYIECKELLTKNKNCDIVTSCIEPPKPAEKLEVHHDDHDDEHEKPTTAA